MSTLFASNGVLLPYLARWMEVERGLNGAEIGAVLALSQLARIFTGPMIAVWADGAHDRRAPIRFLSVAVLAAFAAFFFLAHDFLAMIVLGFVALTLTSALVPFVEAATLRATAEGRMSYGVARGIGSSFFIVANIAGGALIAQFGLGAVVVWMLSACVLMNISAWWALPADPAPESVRASNSRGRLGAGFALMRNGRFLALLAACGLIQAAHAFYYGFSTLVWRGQELAPQSIGFLWALGGVMEVAFLWSLPLIERRLTPEVLIRIAAIAAIVRWTALGFAPTGWLLWPLQALHALTFAAAHVAAMRLISRTAPEAASGLAQTLYSAVTAGVFMGGATLASGFLYDHVGAQGYWLMSAMAAAGGVLAFLLLHPPARAPQA